MPQKKEVPGGSVKSPAKRKASAKIEQSNELLVLVDQAVEKSGLGTLQESKIYRHHLADAYISRFQPHMQALQEISDQIDAINADDPSAEDSQKARELRLALVKNRTGADSTREELKAGLLNEANLIQGCFNVIKSSSAMKEEHLAKIEKHAELKELERQKQLRADREKTLQEYGTDCTFLPLETMSDEQFGQLIEKEKAYLQVKKQQEEQARIQREQEERERQEQERIKELSNSRMKVFLDNGYLYNAEPFGSMSEDEFQALVQAKQTEKEAKVKQEAQEKQEMELFKSRSQELQQYGYSGMDELGKMSVPEYKKILERNKKAFQERQRIAAEEKKEKDANELKMKQQQQELERKQQEERERLEKEETERKAKELADKKAAQAPDKEKLIAFADQLAHLPMPGMKTIKGKDVATEIFTKRDAYVKWIKQQAEAL